MVPGTFWWGIASRKGTGHHLDMRGVVAIVALGLALSGCKNKKTAATTTDASGCPTGASAASNLPLAPTPGTARPLHADGILTTFYIQLQESVYTGYSVDVYDVDLFDTDVGTISALQSTGKKVVCYFSAGSSEDWRDDHKDFRSSDIGKALSGWEGENWLDIRSQNVLNVMKARLDLAVAKGCDGVDPDNMDGYTQDTCFDISAKEQLAYNRKIANLARSRGLSVGLKNAPDLVDDLVTYFDFSVTEQCYQFSECDSYDSFLNASKPVFNLEYKDIYRVNPDRTTLCNYSVTKGIRTNIAALALDDSYWYSCN